MEMFGVNFSQEVGVYIYNQSNSRTETMTCLLEHLIQNLLTASSTRLLKTDFY